MAQNDQLRSYPILQLLMYFFMIAGYHGYSNSSYKLHIVELWDYGNDIFEYTDA